jgi:hypothetical protein
VSGRLLPRLAHLGVEAEIGDQLVGEEKREMSPIAAIRVAAVAIPTPGIVISRLASGDRATNSQSLASTAATS